MENITDSELRQKLSAAGHNVGPFTNTTRGVYYKLLEKITADELKMNTPMAPATPQQTPTRNLKRQVAQTDDEKLNEATFSVPEKKKKDDDLSHHTSDFTTSHHTSDFTNSLFHHQKTISSRLKSGIPTYQAPSLRRSTIESTALSRKLAEEGGGSAKKLPGSTRKLGIRNTEASAGIKKAIDNSAAAETRKGLSNTNKLNLTMTSVVRVPANGSTPGYMRATSNSSAKTGTTTKPGVFKTAGLSTTKPTGASSSRSKIGKGGRKSFRRVGRATPRVLAERKENIPKVGGAGMNKAKGATTAAGAGKGQKKKRAPWDVKGRLEDVTNLYNDLKEEKQQQDEKFAECEADLQQKTGDLALVTIENNERKEELMCTKEQLVENSKKIVEQQLKLDEALLERNEKVASYERIKRERDELEENAERTRGKLREALNHADDLERDVRRSKNAREEVEEQLQKSKKCGEELESKIGELKQDIKMLEETVSKRDNKIHEMEQTLEKERGEKGDVHGILRSRESQIEGLDAKIRSLEQHIKELKDTVTERGDSVEELENSLAKERRVHGDVNRLLEERESSICDLDQRLAVCMTKLHAGEALRRKLHNTIQELKGNIRVYCRVRPFLENEVLKGQPTEEIPQMEFAGDNAGLTIASLQAEKLGRKGETLNHEFTFDHVFGPLHTQEDTFEEVAGLVQSALDGYNVCIFAYGQTGSGKTHTMQGPIDPSSPHRGVIPRAMEQIFKTADELGEQGWVYTLTASFLEIYNETLHDLISSTSEKIEIKLVNDKTRDVEVTNVKNVVVQNTYDVHQLLLKANKNRTVAATKCNERSSRSHSVFRLKIEGKNSKNGDSCVGNLNLVDLAGSERVGHSGSTGQRLKEAQAINTSLSELGNVIMSLNAKKTHVPYRNSKLTYLLCSSLGGNSKTLMFVNVSPLDKHTAESINSLRFASKVNRVDMGTAKKNK